MSELVFVEQAPNQGTEHRLEASATIGREGCDITIGDPDVSRRHAKVQVDNGSATIEDLGSTNGTYVNGERIDAPRSLRDGDEVQIGAIVWRLRAPAGATRLAQVQSGATRLQQATTLRPASPAEPPTSERPASTAESPAVAEAPARAEPPPAAAPPMPEEPPPAAAAGRRGDVPAPDFQPSAIRRVVPAPDTPAPFAPAGQQRRRGSAATRFGATLFCGAVVALTTGGVVLYYLIEPFK
jgi:pSer/pThr/pTyr-binding forkhead associated (FHA) protein